MKCKSVNQERFMVPQHGPVDASLLFVSLRRLK